MGFRKKKEITKAITLECRVKNWTLYYWSYDKKHPYTVTVDFANEEADFNYTMREEFKTMEEALAWLKGQTGETDD